MSDATTESSTPEGARTAGALLRQARQAQGMHIAALAAAIKVTPRKLEALESDRYDELPDTTFTRALAQAVCRALKIDAEPVLALLPQASGKGLEQVTGGLNTPFRERGIRREAADWPSVSRPVVWGAVGLLVLAGVVYFLPPGMVAFRGGASVPEPVASGVAGASPVAAEASSVSVIPTPVAVTPPPAAPVPASAATPAMPSSATRTAPLLAAASSPAAVPPAPAKAGSAPVAGASELSLQTTGPSWVEVQDASGKLLISRTMQAGESVSVAGAIPLRVKIGNSAVTQVRFRGEPVTLPARENVARLELK